MPLGSQPQETFPALGVRHLPNGLQATHHSADDAHAARGNAQSLLDGDFFDDEFCFVHGTLSQTILAEYLYAKLSYTALLDKPAVAPDNSIAKSGLVNSSLRRKSNDDLSSSHPQASASTTVGNTASH